MEIVTDVSKEPRKTVLDEVELWTRDIDRPPVYWLNELAGTGKVTITQTIAGRLDADGRLGASFSVPDALKAEATSSSYSSPLPSNSCGGVSSSVRFSSSLRNRTRKLVSVRSDESTVIVPIDALDECKDNGPVSAILSVHGKFVTEVPKVKFFLTGRPERILEGFRLPLLAKVSDAVFVLHEVKPSQINNGIRLFSTQKLVR